MPEFNFEELVMPQEWRIQGILPKDSIVGVVAPSMSAKSTFVSAVFMYVLSNKSFLGKETEGCDVLLIDQDSQEIGLKVRLKRLHNQLGSRKHRLFYEYMNHLYFSDGSILTAINKYPSAKLVVIDAFNKVGGRNFDFNGISSVALAFEQLKSECLHKEKDRTILIIHHSTEKQEGMTADDYMTTQDHSSLAMGSSAFTESVDCYYILATPERGQLVRSIYVRPISKRVMLLNDPFIVTLVQDDPKKMDIIYKGKWRPQDPEAVQHIIDYFKHVKETATINELIDEFKGQYKWQHFDKALKWLKERGRTEYDVEANNRYRWRYVDKEVAVEKEILCPPHTETGLTMETVELKELIEPKN